MVADEHLPALLLAAEPAIAADLARTRLAPLDRLGAGPRERLVETLRAWLDRPGQVQAVAAALDGPDLRAVERIADSDLVPGDLRVAHHADVHAGDAHIVTRLMPPVSANCA